MKKTLMLTFGLILTLAVSGVAQKFGYLNSVALLSEMSEVKQADSDLQAYQTQLTKRGQEMVKTFEAKVGEFQRKQKQGLIAPKDEQTQALELQAEEKTIKDYEDEVKRNLYEKQQKLYQPIMERVNQAMQEVAKENGFLMVFDTNTQVLLYADESLDITNLVKAKLNIPVDTTDGK